MPSNLHCINLSRYITMLWLKASFILSGYVTMLCSWGAGLLHHNAMIESLLYPIHQICTVLTRVVTLQCCVHEGPRLEPLRHNAMIESLLYPIHQICTVLTRVVTLQCCVHEGPRLEPLRHNAMIESLLYPIHQNLHCTDSSGYVTMLCSRGAQTWAVRSQCYDWKPPLSYPSNLHCTDSSGYVTMLWSWGAQTWAVTSQYYAWKPPLSYPIKCALYWLEWLRYNAVIMRGPD